MARGSTWRDGHGHAAPDRGAASLWALSAGLVFVLAGATAAAYGSAIVSRHRAQTAADLGALGGATRAVHGEREACALAGRLVTANGGRVIRCRVDGLDVIVMVEVPVTGIAGLATATSAARAGPVRG